MKIPSNYVKISLTLILAVVAISTRVSAAAEMKTDALAVRFDGQGRMAVDTLYGKPFPLIAFTELAGCSTQGEVRTETRGKTLRQSGFFRSAIGTIEPARMVSTPSPCLEHFK